jgi:hypothetical protein
MIVLLLFGLVRSTRGSTNSGYGGQQIRTDDLQSSQKASADRQAQKELHLKCVAAAGIAERDAAAMIPGRT